jgi:hypothetical protein
MMWILRRAVISIYERSVAITLEDSERRDFDKCRYFGTEAINRHQGVLVPAAENRFYLLVTLSESQEIREC